MRTISEKIHTLGCFICFLAILFCNGPVLAQNCIVQDEAIVKLRLPRMGSYNVWDSVYGEVGTNERFKSGLVMESGHLLVAGEYVDPKKGPQKSLIFAEIGRNGRVVWEVRNEVPDLADVVKILPHEKGYAVLANMSPERGRLYIWLGVFDKEGALLSQKTIKGGRADLTAYDIEEDIGSKSYILAAYAEEPGSVAPGNTILYRLSMAGKILSDNAFVVGAENSIRDLYILKNGNIMAVGDVRDAGGRKTGWIVQLGKGLRMVWQKPYPRGAGATLHKGASLRGDLFVVGGTALPLVEGYRAGWLMAVHENSGEIYWQRYFSGNLHFDGRDVITNTDGVISFLMDGQMPDMTGMEAMAGESMENMKDAENVEEHVRLLTLDPRGVMLNSEAYFNGAGVDAFQLLQSQGPERLIVGETLIDHQMEEGDQGPMAMKKPAAEGEDAGPIIKRSREGWALAAQGADPFTDPCIPRPRSVIQ